MNKKEILEIKKLLKKENTHIDRIAGCYVDGEKEIRAVFEMPFYSVGDEEMFKYSELFRKTLSGTIGKNLNTLAFSTEEEMNGSRHASLVQLVKSELKEEEIRQAFFDSVIANYTHSGNYLILLAHGLYDIPARSTDSSEIFDASEYVYSFVLCSICPVNLSKPGLCFDAASSSFVEHLRDWMVEMPEAGFLFPAFNDRNTDLHALLYYAKNGEALHPELTEGLLGCASPVSAGDQKMDFAEVVEEVFGGECDFQTVKEIHDTLNQMLEENKEEPEPLVLGEQEIKKLLSECGADDEMLAGVEKQFRKGSGENDEEMKEENAGSRKSEGLMASNLANTRRFEVKTPEITISVSPQRTDLIETMMIEGRECLVIPLDEEVTVNGIAIRPGRRG